LRRRVGIDGDKVQLVEVGQVFQGHLYDAFIVWLEVEHLERRAT
jgi:hypothetical protein